MRGVWFKAMLIITTTYACTHSAIGYVTPLDMLAGRQAEIHAARDRKLAGISRLLERS